MKFKINSQKNQITFFLNSKVYPLEAIYSTAYVFLDKAYVFLDGDPKKEIIVYLKGKNNLSRKKLEALQGEFHNELLNYLLRIKIAKSNKKIREFVIGTALVSALPIPSYSSEKLVGSYSEDPLDIAVPWEKKYKKSSKKKRKR
jgi:His-Xaa-Ser system protein HxsD